MIVAEFCQNHLGDLSLLKQMIRDCCEAKVWAAKIQTFFANDLSKDWQHEKDRLKSLELNWQAHDYFYKECKDHGIIPITSIYSKDYIPNLKEIGFEYIKIGSAQALGTDLINACTDKFNILISTGGNSLTHIPYGNYHTVFHCVSSYPTDPYHSDLGRIKLIKDLFPHSKAGFSSHVDPTHNNWLLAIGSSYAFGAEVIEVHYTSIEREKVKDGKVSLNKEQLEELCEFDKIPSVYRQFRWPWYGLYSSPKTHKELELIKKYQGRWK